MTKTAISIYLISAWKERIPGRIISHDHHLDLVRTYLFWISMELVSSRREKKLGVKKSYLVMKRFQSMFRI